MALGTPEHSEFKAYNIRAEEIRDDIIPGFDDTNPATLFTRTSLMLTVKDAIRATIAKEVIVRYQPH